MKNVNIDMASLIADMLEKGASTEDIAALFTNALNAESAKAAEIKKAKAKAKEEDAIAILKMVAAFMKAHYGDNSWDDELVAKGAKEFIKTMDMAQEFAKSLDKITVKATPVVDKFVKKDDFSKAMADFEAILASL